MSTPLAEDMADALNQMGASLVQHRIIPSNTAFSNAASQLKRQRGKHSWEYRITKAEAIEFFAVQNKQLDRPVHVKIYSDTCIRHIEATDKSCFEKLDLALEVWDEERLLIKHHVDLANKGGAEEYQEGPLFHLQFGGHSPGGDKNFEVALKEPRWLYFPMDLILLCELVVANFFPDKWKNLQREAGWTDAIVSSQKFCLSPFIAKISEILNTSSDTLLRQLWGKTSGHLYRSNGL